MKTSRRFYIAHGLHCTAFGPWLNLAIILGGIYHYLGLGLLRLVWLRVGKIYDTPSLPAGVHGLCKS